MLSYLDKIFEMWKEVRESKRSRRSFKQNSKRYQDDFIDGLLVAAKKAIHTDALRRFAKSLMRKVKNLFAFTEEKGIEPTNNQAERDLRHAVIWRKICHGTKSDRGDRFVERIQSVMTTLQRQGLKCLDFLTEAVRAMKAGKPAPSVLRHAC